MPGPKPPTVPLSEEERHALHTMIRAHKTPHHLSFRAHVILLLAEGLTAPDVGPAPRDDAHHRPTLASPLAQAPRLPGPRAAPRRSASGRPCHL